MCLVIIPSDKQNIHKIFLNTEIHSLAQNCVNVANIFITCYFVTWHFCKHMQTVQTYIHTITHKIFLILKLKVDNQMKQLIECNARIFFLINLLKKWLPYNHAQI